MKTKTENRYLSLVIPFFTMYTHFIFAENLIRKSIMKMKNRIFYPIISFFRNQNDFFFVKNLKNK